MRFCQQDEELFLIGGAQLYQEGLSLVNKLYITRVNLEVAGDAFLPEIDLSTWAQTEKKDHVSASGLSYSDLTYIRK